MIGRKATHNIVKLLLLMNVYQNVAIYRPTQPRSVYLTRLKNRIAIGQNYRPAPFLHALNDLERIRVQEIEKRIVNHKIGNCYKARVMPVFNAVALQRPKIIRITEFIP